MLTFKNAVITASQVLPKFYTSLHLSAEDGIVSISAQGDSEMMFIKAEVSGANFEHVAVDGKKFANFIKALDDLDFSFFREKGVFYVKTKKGKYDFGIADVEPIEMQKVEEQKIEGIDVKQIIDCSFCTSNDEFRLAMTGVCLSGDMIFATDSYRGYFAKSGTNIDGEIIIPKGRMNRLKIFNNPNVWINKDLVKFQENGMIYICSLFNDRYPPLMNVIPTSSECKIEFNRLELISVLRRIEIFDKTTRFEFSENLCSISAINAEDQTACNERIACKFVERSTYFETTYGFDLTIGLNVNLLIEILLHINTESVTFVYKNESSPVLLDNYLIMPIRIKK